MVSLIEEVAERFGVPRETVLRWRREGVTIPGVPLEELRALVVTRGSVHNRRPKTLRRREVRRTWEQEPPLLPEERLLRPKTRGDCKDGPRPCPWVGCRYHMYLEVTEDGGLRFSTWLQPEEMTESCVLDIADRGELEAVSVARVLGSCRQRIEQIEKKAVEHFQRSVRRMKAEIR